jgi:hypothetical protein
MKNIRFSVIGIAMSVVLLLTWLASFGLPSDASGAQGSLTLNDAGVQIAFPQAMLFNVEATSPQTVNNIRLHYRVERMNIADITSEAWPRFTPATSVKTRFTWDMRKGSIPLATRVEYWWTAANTAGDTQSSPKRVAVFEDTRYKWQKIAQDTLTLNWYSGDNPFAQTLLASALAGLQKLNQDTGVRLEQPVSLYVYASSKDLQGAMISPREWTGGSAYPEYGVITLGIGTREIDWGKKATVHELGHMVVNQLTFGPYEATLPTWLNEGMAMYAEGGLDLVSETNLQRAVTEHRTISLRSLSSPFSAVPAQALLSYAESYSVVNYLVKTYGKDKLIRLFSAFKTGATADGALKLVYGLDQDSLYLAWLASFPVPSSPRTTS